MKDDFKFEVAFSFVERDLLVAQQIADRIRDRVSVYVYPENPEVFAGTDGIDQHHRIYEDEARVVVILHRREWGQTQWTQVEETAIKNRILKEGYDFMTVVPLDDSATPPWFPSTRIRFGLDRYGIDGVASVIEAAVQSKGGTVRSESAVDYAARIARSLNFELERREWYESERGVEAATQEFDRLLKEFQILVEEITERTPRLKIDIEVGRHFKCRNIEMQVLWRPRHKNSLKDSNLRVVIFREHLRHSWSSEVVRDKLHNVEYNIDWDLGRQLVWRELGDEKRFFTSHQLADNSVKVFLDKATNRSEDDEDTDFD